VLVTTDSILHAMHRTYDDLLMEMEQTFLTDALDEVLSKCHELVESEAPSWGQATSACTTPTPREGTKPATERPAWRRASKAS
jgi:hypothetical protein